MNALQLQNLATLAAAAAAAQTSATTTNANPLSTTTGALGALTSPGMAEGFGQGGGGGGFGTIPSFKPCPEVEGMFTSKSQWGTKP